MAHSNLYKLLSCRVPFSLDRIMTVSSSKILRIALHHLKMNRILYLYYYTFNRPPSILFYFLVITAFTVLSMTNCLLILNIKTDSNHPLEFPFFFLSIIVFNTATTINKPFQLSTRSLTYIIVLNMSQFSCLCRLFMPPSSHDVIKTINQTIKSVILSEI